MIERQTMETEKFIAPRDRLGRPLRQLRLSVTDRCDLRCRYCMPEADYTWLPPEAILRFEEISTIVDGFTGLGTRKIRLTGGEPLLRRGLPELVRILAAKPGVEDLSMTTNGVRLRDHAESLIAAGLDRFTVSLDTLRSGRFRRLTGRDELDRVIAGLETVSRAGTGRLKINMVVIRGINEDEVADMVRFGSGLGAEVRLIEYMDVGGATQWLLRRVVPADEILRGLEAAEGPAEPIDAEAASPARRYRLSDGTEFGLIASVTAPFCRDCDRCRLTADGRMYLCLYADDGPDLRAMVRRGETADAMAAAIAKFWENRTDRGAEARLAVADRGPLYAIGRLRGDPHLEMHTRGG